MQHFWRRLFALILVCLVGLLLAMPAAAEDTGSISLPATLALRGTMPAGAGPYSFTLTAADAANPMPAGAVGDTKTVTLNKAGAIDFGSIAFADIGEYAYSIRQIPGSAKDCTYDSREYSATVYVRWKDEVGGPVNTILVLTLEGSDTKPAEIAFENIGKNPKPTPTTSAKPTPTATTQPTPTASAQPTPTATTQPTPTATTQPVPTSTTQPAPSATPSPVPNVTASPAVTPAPTAIPAPSENPTATPAPTPEPTATAVPSGSGDGSLGGTSHGGSDDSPQDADEWTAATDPIAAAAAAAAAQNAAMVAYMKAHGMLPQTSDDAPILLFVVLAGASLVAFVVMFLRKRRKNKDKPKD